MEMQHHSSQGERLLRLPRVLERVGVSRSTAWLWIRQGRFPKPVKIGPNITAWRESEIESWIAERIASAKGGGA
jgi:prophage regulatory protein